MLVLPLQCDDSQWAGASTSPGARVSGSQAPGSIKAGGSLSGYWAAGYGGPSRGFPLTTVSAAAGLFSVSRSHSILIRLFTVIGQFLLWEAAAPLNMKCWQKVKITRKHRFYTKTSTCSHRNYSSYSISFLYELTAASVAIFYSCHSFFFGST